MTPEAAQKVIVYSTPLCAPCEALKRYLRSREVAFVVKDLMVDEDAAEFIEGRGIRSTPVLQVSDQLYFGSDLAPERLEKLFAA